MLTRAVKHGFEVINCHWPQFLLHRLEGFPLFDQFESLFHFELWVTIVQVKLFGLELSYCKHLSLCILGYIKESAGEQTYNWFSPSHHLYLSSRFGLQFCICRSARSGGRRRGSCHYGSRAQTWSC
jgi:hypothetical protein